MVVLATSLAGCGEDAAEDDVTGGSGTSVVDGQEPAGGGPDDAGAGTPDAAAPESLPDFPFPEDYSVITTGSRGNAFTGVFEVPGGWEDLKAFYEEALPAAGWTVQGDRPFVTKEGTEIDASKDNLDATVGVSSVNGQTSLVVNIVEG